MNFKMPAKATFWYSSFKKGPNYVKLNKTF